MYFFLLATHMKYRSKSTITIIKPETRTSLHGNRLSHLNRDDTLPYHHDHNTQRLLTSESTRMSIDQNSLTFRNDCSNPITHGCFSEYQPSNRHTTDRISSAICIQKLDDSQGLRIASIIAFCHVLHRSLSQVIHR